MIIHMNLKEAQIACENYVKAISELSERLGVHEFCEDSCANMIIMAKYYDENRAVQKYYHEN